MDIQKQVEDKCNALRIQIANYKITRKNLPDEPELAFLCKRKVDRHIERIERELHMLETQWRFK